MVLLGQVVPNFTAKASGLGEIDFHEFIGKEAGSWVILFSHPADFTPVCTTELAAFAKAMPELAKRNVRPIALSCDDVESHVAWGEDVKAYGCMEEFKIPIIADPSRDIANAYGMMDPVEKDKAGLPLTARSVFVIGPDMKLKLSILYPATTGRNVEEVLRAIDSLQLTATKKVATPVNWKVGDDVIVPPNVTADEVAQIFPDVKIHELPSGKQYLRSTKMPEL